MVALFGFFMIIIIIAIAAVVLVTERISSVRLRALIRTTIIAIFVAPVVISGHGVYIGPAIILCLLDLSYESCVEYALPSILTTWFLMFTISVMYLAQNKKL